MGPHTCVLPHLALQRAVDACLRQVTQSLETPSHVHCDRPKGLNTVFRGGSGGGSRATANKHEERASGLLQRLEAVLGECGGEGATVLTGLTSLVQTAKSGQVLCEKPKKKDKDGEAGEPTSLVQEPPAKKAKSNTGEGLPTEASTGAWTEVVRKG